MASITEKAEKPGNNSKTRRILLTGAFRRRDGKFAVLGYESCHEIRMVNFRYTRNDIDRMTPSGPPVTGLGSLEKLPQELIYEILSHLSIETTMRFQHVNRGAREVVYHSKGFQAVVDHTPEALYGVIKARMADTMSIADIYTPLCRTHCEKCGDAGQYLYLPTLTRCCPRCLHLDPAFRTVPLVSFAKENGFSPQRLRKLVTVVSGVPRKEGGYAYGEASCTRRTNFVNYAEAKEAVERITGTMIQDTEPQTKQSYVVSCNIPVYDKLNKRSYAALSCKGCAKGVSNEVALELKEYTEEDFVEHFWKCKAAQDLWKWTKKAERFLHHLDNNDMMKVWKWTKQAGRFHQYLENDMMELQGCIREWNGVEWVIPQVDRATARRTKPQFPSWFLR
jgi:hypothetical protein